MNPIYKHIHLYKLLSDGMLEIHANEDIYMMDCNDKMVIQFDDLEHLDEFIEEIKEFRKLITTEYKQ